VRSLLNHAACREYALEQVKQLRHGRFTRISKEWLDELEGHLKASIAARVHRAASIGKTLKP